MPSHAFFLCTHIRTASPSSYKDLCHNGLEATHISTLSLSQNIVEIREKNREAGRSALWLNLIIGKSEASVYVKRAKISEKGVISVTSMKWQYSNAYSNIFNSLFSSFSFPSWKRLDLEVSFYMLILVIYQRLQILTRTLSWCH